MRVLLLDNYDSFTYNLYHYLEGESVETVVCRNDEIATDRALSYDALVLSPGPGLPSEAGIMNKLIEQWPEHKPVLGICLGLQAIVEVYGGTLRNLESVIHGRSTVARKLTDDFLFDRIPHTFEVGHYHSWVADTLPDDMETIAVNEQNLIMAVRHKHRPIRAVQFHPESVLTPFGRTMIRNWILSWNGTYLHT